MPGPKDHTQEDIDLDDAIASYEEVADVIEQIDEGVYRDDRQPE